MNMLQPILTASGLGEDTQLVVQDTLSKFIQSQEEWSKTADEIVITDPSETGKMKMAREARLSLKNTRLECEKLVKAKREIIKERMTTDLNEDKLWLKAGQLIETTFKSLEAKFEEKEKFKERWEENEKKKLKELREKRIEETPKISKFIPKTTDLASLSEEVFESLLQEAQHQLDEEDRKERERIAQEIADKEEKERLQSKLNEAMNKIAEFEKEPQESKTAEPEIPLFESIEEPVLNVFTSDKSLPSKSDATTTKSDSELLKEFISQIKAVTPPKLSDLFSTSNVEMEQAVFIARLEVLLKDIKES